MRGDRPDPLKPLMTPGEVAHVMRVNVEVVRRWARAGRLPGKLKLGGRLRFRPDAIADYLRELEAESRTGPRLSDPAANRRYARARDALGLVLDETA